MEHSLFSTVISIIIILFTATTESHGERNLWTYDRDGYNGPDNWELSFPSCGGANQSPINIDTSTVQVNQELSPFVFHNFDNPFLSSILYNTGHTAQLILERSDAVQVKGGGLGGTFQFDQLHFHWDSTSMTQGSEHTINGRHYPVEMHLVAFNEKYPNFTVASLYDDGIAVFAVFVKLPDSRNYLTSLQPIVENFEKISIPGSAVKLTSPIYFEDLLPADITRYFRYQGSLTTPPCSEVVTWTVFEETVPVNANELLTFRMLVDVNGNPLQHCHRPVQPLNDRLIVIPPYDFSQQKNNF